MREALNPENNTGIMLPNDQELLADLTAPKWAMQGNKIIVESRENIVKRIQRSPDKASAVIMAMMNTPKQDFSMLNLQALGGRQHGEQYDPESWMRERGY